MNYIRIYYVKKKKGKKSKTNKRKIRFIIDKQPSNGLYQLAVHLELTVD